MSPANQQNKLYRAQGTGLKRNSKNFKKKFKKSKKKKF